MSSQFTNRVLNITNEEQVKVSLKPSKLNKQITNTADSHGDRVIKNGFDYSTIGENQAHQSANNLEDNISLEDNLESNNNSDKASKGSEKTVDLREMSEDNIQDYPARNIVNLVSTEVKYTNLSSIHEANQVNDLIDSNCQQLYNLLSKSWLGSWLDNLSDREEIRAIDAKYTNTPHVN